MFQSNFDKLIKTNPNLSKKANQPITTAKTTTPKRVYERVEDKKFSSMSKRLDESKVSQLKELTKLTAISETGAAMPTKATKRDRAVAQILGDSGARADRSAPVVQQSLQPKLTPQQTATLLREKEKITKQIEKQNTHIENYKNIEWWHTTKSNFHVPPLHDPLVLVHHYALGPKNQTVFDLARVETDVRDERDYQHVLVRVAVLTKYGQVIYDQLVQPIEKVTDYRTEITGVSRSDFQIDYEKMKRTQSKSSQQLTTVFMNPKVHTLSQVRNAVAELIENRIIIGYLLSSNSALFDLEKQALLHTFSQKSVKRNMSATQQRELLDDYKTEQTLKNKNYLLDLLQLSHPNYLMRDFGHGKIIAHQEFLINQFILPSLSGFLHTQQRRLGLLADGSAVQSNPDTTKGGLVKDNFLSLSRPLGFVSLDILLNNAMATFQLYMIFKNQWEALWKQSNSVQLTQYRTKIMELSKLIDERKQLAEIARERELLKKNRRDYWEMKEASNKGSSDDESDGKSEDEDDSDDDDDDSDSGASRW